LILAICTGVAQTSPGAARPVDPASSPKLIALTRDVDSEDYFCVGKDLSKCPQPSLHDYVLRTIEQRERKGVFDHILVFHEIPNSVELLSHLIPETEEAGVYVRDPR
jgi:hypothetical protein